MAKILFICCRDASRARMAEEFAMQLGPAEAGACSASDDVRPPHPMLVKVMAEKGVDVTLRAPMTPDMLSREHFDVVIAMCENAREECPTLPGPPALITWNVGDPAAAGGTEEEILGAWRTVRDNIHGLVSDFFSLGYYQSLTSQKKNFETLINNLKEGVFAHDNERTIIHFNREAERITGFKAEEVVGKQCPLVFPEGFCGGKCSFQSGAPPDFDCIRFPLDYTAKNGEKKRLEMSVTPMTDETGARVGVMASFRDMTHEFDLEMRLRETTQFSGIIGQDHKMQAVYRLVRDVADSDAPVLIQGETGTGKELIAAAIHNESRRAGKLFVPVNCGALPEGIIESELFGHVRGAFTGAVKDKKGRFELADHGTIFLDEIGDLPGSVQVKLLRVLQEGTFERVGGEQTMTTDVRVISATNKDLKTLMARGEFRSDLYYRLAVVPVILPPLRERRNDIPLLAEHFLDKMSRGADRGGLSFSRDCLLLMMDFDWPGNVRQLENALRFAMMKCKGNVIGPEHLPPEIVAAVTAPQQSKPGRRQKLDAPSVKRAIEDAGGNKARAAANLGVGRATLYRFMAENGVE